MPVARSSKPSGEKNIIIQQVEFEDEQRAVRRCPAHPARPTTRGQNVTLRERLQAAVKDAMRAKERHKVTTLRLILAAVKDRDIVRRTEADERDDDVIITEIMARMIKQRHDSVTAYEEGGRLELAEKEREEIAVIESFLPRQLDDSEIEAACRKVVADLDATTLKDIGRCMAKLKEDYAGQMDFGKASKIIKDILSNG